MDVERVMAGVVVAVATVPAIPFALTTETDVTVPAEAADKTPPAKVKPEPTVADASALLVLKYASVLAVAALSFIDVNEPVEGVVTPIGVPSIDPPVITKLAGVWAGLTGTTSLEIPDGLLVDCP
jgi:hypothetical protein